MAQLTSMPSCLRRATDSRPNNERRHQYSVMPRVLELFAKRGLVPSLWHSRIAPTGELTIDLQLEGMEAPLARHIAACLRQIWGVSTVLTAEKG